MNAKKVEILKALLDILAEDDINTVFLKWLSGIRDLGYKLQNEPEVLLKNLENYYASHNCT